MSAFVSIVLATRYPDLAVIKSLLVVTPDFFEEFNGNHSGGFDFAEVTSGLELPKSGTEVGHMISRGFSSISSLFPSSLRFRPHTFKRIIMRPLTADALNPAVLNVQYAVRGELAIRAEELRAQLKEDNHGLPLTEQVAALMEWPALAEIAPDAFPKDVIARAKELQEEIGSIGAYSHSQGVPFIRQNVAKFIEARRVPLRPQPHFPHRRCFSRSLAPDLHANLRTQQLRCPDPHTQYPLYTATLAQFSGVPLPYHLDEAADWATSVHDIEAAIEKAHREGVTAKSLVIINPGNPTGALLDENTQIELVKLCEKYSLVLLADEVYQINLHKPTTHPFTSFKKIVSQIQSPVPLVSFHSISKGVSGECGRRGGYFECTNFPVDILALIYKMVSVGLCPPLSGQIGVDSMVRPPQPGDDSYELWKKETDEIHAALAHRTGTMSQRLNALPGVSCVDSPGALYLYPQIRLSDKAIEAAREARKEPDAFYALQLLHDTGSASSPGAGLVRRRASGITG
ncbi:pyridoxal phosphate-dependent transferase [Salix suchowensis]|nr:pyridoxal phosphate-dependent transferase [Salix suchowensis]